MTFAIVTKPHHTTFWKICFGSIIRLFADDCVIYKKIINNEDIEICRKIWAGWGSGRQKMR
jgi:hypothetical protein